MEYLYKYRNINEDNIKDCYSIKNLINNNALISSRTKFDDEYDSKIDLVKPSYDLVKRLKSSIPRTMFQDYKGLINKDGFTKHGNRLFSTLERMLENMIDSYGIYCLTDIGTNNDMWNNYANFHKGFCIKFNKESLGKDFGVFPMHYQKEIAKLNIYTMMRIYFKIGSEEQLAQEIHEKLCVKLDSYKFEQEYRYIMSGHLNGNDYMLKKYPKEAVSEVIFGSEMKAEVKDYIIKHTNFKYSEIINDKGSLKIIDCKF